MGSRHEPRRIEGRRAIPVGLFFAPLRTECPIRAHRSPGREGAEHARIVTASGAGVALEGNTRLDMTTYGVEPPVVMLGMLKVGPQIRIEFKGVVVP